MTTLMVIQKIKIFDLLFKHQHSLEWIYSLILQQIDIGALSLIHSLGTVQEFFQCDEM